MIKFRTNIYGFNKSDVIKFVNEVADEYESIYNKLKNATIQIESLNKELERYKDLEKTLNDTLLLAQETSANAQKAAYAQSKLIVEDAKNNASKIVNNSLIKAQNIEREAEELQRKVISYKKRFIALVESQVDEMDKFDERLK
ncbi:MAG: DivIVA domain-containing protein [bacterium]|nr:DivIVA domain-containing protein [bacterium]